MRSAGARKRTNMRVAEKMHVTVPESDAVRMTAERDSKKVKEACMTVGEACAAYSLVEHHRRSSSTVPEGDDIGSGTMRMLE
jgi:hypothetical protein